MATPPIKIIKATQQKSSDTWPLPNVQSKPSEQESQKTNAFGKKSNWVFEPPESEEPEPQPLTAQEIEEIRQAASAEGFSQGKEEGFAKGYEEGKAKGIEDGKALGITLALELDPPQVLE
jgi:flagellar assembly protein FliH